MTSPSSADSFGVPSEATDGDLGDRFFQVFGRIVVLAAANERLLALALADIEGASINQMIARPALLTGQATERALGLLQPIRQRAIGDAAALSAIGLMETFINQVRDVVDLRNGYIHSAWLVDERRPFADNFERRPEFFALRLSPKKADPGIVQHFPRNLAELEVDLARFIDINTCGRSAVDSWRQLKFRAPDGRL